MSRGAVILSMLALLRAPFSSSQNSVLNLEMALAKVSVDKGGPTYCRADGKNSFTVCVFFALISPWFYRKAVKIGKKSFLRGM